MTELRRMLADTTERVLGSIAGARGADAWVKIAGAALCNVMVAEDKGGFGGGWEDAQIIMRSTGHHAIDAPLAEAIIANRLIAEAELILPDGMVTISPRTKGRVRRGKFRGEMDSVPYGNLADSIAALVKDGDSLFLVVADRSNAEITGTSSNPAGEPRANLKFVDANVQAAPLRSGVDQLFVYFALARAIQISGALGAALGLSARYVRDRQQFGRALASFQAIQQQMAVFAEEAAAALAASVSACRAADRCEARFEIASAKLRCNRAAATGASTAHQVHGAMGFTAEYALQKFTRRLWAWRSEFGNDRYWENEIGSLVAARGPEGFWPSLVDGDFTS